MKPHKTKQSPQKAVDLRKDKRMLRRQEPRRRSSQPSPRPSAAPPRGSAPWTRPQPSGTTSRWGIRRPPPRGFGIPAKSSRETAGRRWGSNWVKKVWIPRESSVSGRQERKRERLDPSVEREIDGILSRLRVLFPCLLQGFGNLGQ
ncbi:hypothetical protein BHE74_00024950 [Ensete ventricosum]|nr:hypothetical protein BHE74_00024950 [Ensete ventricosum]